MEIWKEIEDFNKYLVSNQGRCRNKDTNYILKPIKTKYGYLEYELTNEFGKKRFKAHRLVATAFVKNPLCKPQVNHIDENKRNNSFENLEWVTAKENNNHGTKNDRTAEKLSKKVNQFSRDGVFIKTFSGCSKASKELNISVSSIIKCANGQRATAGNFVWKY